MFLPQGIQFFPRIFLNLFCFGNGFTINTWTARETVEGFYSSSVKMKLKWRFLLRVYSDKVLQSSEHFSEQYTQNVLFNRKALSMTINKSYPKLTSRVKKMKLKWSFLLCIYADIVLQSSILRPETFFLNTRLKQPS